MSTTGTSGTTTFNLDLSGVSYTYLHCKPNGTPFYVGKGVRNRYKDFTYRNDYHKRIVKKYEAENILIGKLWCSSDKIALQLEVGLIKCLKNMGVKLTNLTEGGEGAVGRPCSDRARLAVSEANKKRVWTPEQRENIGAHNRGKKRPEHAAKMAALGRWKGESNMWFGAGDRQKGSKNHMARKVIGAHSSLGTKEWETLSEAARDLQVSLQAVCQAIRKKHMSKGWVLEYKNDD